MNSAVRTILGAASGALIVLLVHPLSRPFLTTCFTKWGPSSASIESPLLAENLSVLPQPQSVVEASLWMEAGAKRLQERAEISDQNVDALIRVAESAHKAEQSNAFWLEMKAVFLGHLGRDDEAIRAWRDAALCQGWNDYQSTRLKAVRDEIAREVGAVQSWQAASMYFQRALNCANQIERFGRSQISGAPFETREGLLQRYYSLRNGARLRDGSRSVAVGLYGVSLVEASSFKQRRKFSSTPRKLLVARYGFLDALSSAGLIEEREIANDAFINNEAWLALVLRQDARENMQSMAAASFLVATVPSALIMTGIAGTAIWGLSRLTQRYPKSLAVLRQPLAPLLGLVLAIIGYVLTEHVLLAVTTVASFSFLAFGPQFERKVVPDSLGPLFSFSVGLLAIVFTSLLAFFFMGLTPPAYGILPHLDIATDYGGGQTLPLGLAAIVLALVLLLAPMWSIVQRHNTALVAVHTLKAFGRSVACISLAGAIISTPLAVYIDTKLGANTEMALLNEPSYYFTR